MSKIAAPQFKKAVTVSDIETVSALAFIIWRESYAEAHAPGQTEYMLNQFQTSEAIQREIDRDGTAYYLIIDEAGKDVGYFAVVPDGDRLFLSKLYLLPECRGKGWSRIVFDFVFILGRESGCRAVWLKVAQSNTRAQAVYKKIGFTFLKEAVNPIGEGYFMKDYYLEYSLR